MTPPASLVSATVRIDAVVSRLRMPAEALAAVAPGDFIEIEPEAGGGLIVQFSIGGTTMALASVQEVDGRLMATIISGNWDVNVRALDQWKLRKPKAPKD